MNQESESVKSGGDPGSQMFLSSVGEGNMNYENLVEELDESSSLDNIAFQLFEGEEMNSDMANFIGIHMLNDLTDFA